MPHGSLDPMALLSQLIGSFNHPFGYLAVGCAGLAAVLIVVSCFVKTILPLRLLAVGSNAGFMAYGLLQPAPMIFLLHATLLPLNLFRAVEMARLTKQVKSAATTRQRGDVWLKPYMRSRPFAAGEVLFRKGDIADKLYFLVEGQIDLVEAGRSIPVGELFGEIAFFAPDRRRTGTARCATIGKVLTIDESSFKQLYFQNPAFGFEVVRLLAGRLSQDAHDLERRLAELANAASTRTDAPTT